MIYYVQTKSEFKLIEWVPRVVSKRGPFNPFEMSDKWPPSSILLYLTDFLVWKFIRTIKYYEETFQLNFWKLMCLYTAKDRRLMARRPYYLAGITMLDIKIYNNICGHRPYQNFPVRVLHASLPVLLMGIVYPHRILCIVCTWFLKC